MMKTKKYFISLALLALPHQSIGHQNPGRRPSNYLPIQSLSVLSCGQEEISENSPNESNFQVELFRNTQTKGLLISSNFPLVKNGRAMSELSEGLLANISHGKAGPYNARFFQLREDHSQAQVFSFSPMGSKVINCHAINGKNSKTRIGNTEKEF